jgi:hypothetical protein
VTKRKPKSQHKRQGRPPSITPEKLDMFIKAFGNGLNDKESCCYAEISESVFYEYCKKNPKFQELKERLKQKPLVQAKINILEAIKNKDIQTTKWYLEKKNRDEFGDKREIEHSGNISFTALIEDIEDD